MTYREMLDNLLDPRSFFTFLSWVAFIVLVAIVIGVEISNWIRRENTDSNETTTKGNK